jgi:four helix bundle protein
VESGKLKAEKQKAESGNEKPGKSTKVEMREGRLTDEFRARTKKFAALIIRFYVQLPKERDEVQVCARQILLSGTSVAAHVPEAARVRSKVEFMSKLGGALQEADETQLWLELLREECGIDCSLTTPIEQEANELIAIFTTISRRTGAK